MLDPPLHELLKNSSPETLTSLKLDEVGGKAHISKSSKKTEMPKKSCVRVHRGTQVQDRIPIYVLSIHELTIVA